MYKVDILFRCAVLHSIEINEDDKQVLEDLFKQKNERTQAIYHYYSNKEGDLVQIDLRDVSMLSYEELDSDETEETQV